MVRENVFKTTETNFGFVLAPSQLLWATFWLQMVPPAVLFEPLSLHKGFIFLFLIPFKAHAHTVSY